MPGPITLSSQERALWRLFSAPVVRDLLRAGGGGAATQLLRSSGFRVRGKTLGSAYSDLYRRLATIEPAQYAYKNALAQRVLYSKYGARNNQIFFEFRTGASKLDALIVNESLHAIEVKSELDQLTRLQAQVADYKLRFSHVWVFCSERNLRSIERIVSSDVGLICLRQNRLFSIARPATCDQSKLNSVAILEMLRRQEYLSILKRFGFQEEKMPNTRLFSEAMRFGANIDPLLLHEELRLALSPRVKSFSASTLKRIPYELRGAVVSQLMKPADVDHLLENLRQKI
jgi:hypothetical protein